MGRAGRDGAEAQCLAYLSDSDFTKLRSLAFSGLLERPALRAFLGTLFEEPPPAAPAPAPATQVRTCSRGPCWLSPFLILLRA